MWVLSVMSRTQLKRKVGKNQGFQMRRKVLNWPVVIGMLPKKSGLPLGQSICEGANPESPAGRRPKQEQLMLQAPQQKPFP